MQMRSLFSRRHVAGGVAAMACAVVAAPDAKAVDCSTLSNPVYVTGSSAVKPFLAQAAAKLTAQNITIVYYSQASCAGPKAMSTNPAQSLQQTGLTYWDNTATPVPGGCDNTLGTGDKVDIGVSDVYAETCAQPVATGVVDKHGPIQIMGFVVPKGSVATSISREAAYMVYGFGAAAGKQVAPWTSAATIFQRNAGSGTENMIATAIGVPAAKWQGGTNPGSGDLLTSVLGTAAKDTTIGILATDFADQNRDKVTFLPYQHTDQGCGYLPDSTATSFDKANVRDGHYMIWGPLHMYVQTPMSSTVQSVVDQLTLDTDDGTIIDAESKAGVVPECAMHVSRTGEVGPLASFSPAKPCECRFLTTATGTKPADCTVCTVANEATDCAGNARGTKCNYGYCEGN